ncbi:MAG TPA: AbrB/MazE/SpoVT family DNA-binding domain-containing protein [Nanoarchaeota archaeon]|nr:AbrB/MazE/SpoVT family DNA-binding domain-containing protein [Candidatus Pacearchaeota archaeon]HIH17214.1 AbrB/MazE/SpoVT family DNA-binding domain-containing protein [Nanoarchaeota archaeon]HIH34556.1 AbrB/MazE/SpoVT family DNA-binding domain-containing protein [Nanoarchaeota archaeon]HIH51870.1 AbrB/MazE/SpoVT family DNA-binding domain-containing protein [Nanoarchaeota archaeon]HIH66569.1 AbrB/MazE/SpoVT family DNA-binding domain-containing protein [Nanoarchaeota archaeon]
MIEIETKTKKWGNSLGVIIPRKLAQEAGLREEEMVRVVIQKQKGVVKVKDIFGKLKGWKKPTSQIMKEIDKDLDSKIFKLR